MKKNTSAQRAATSARASQPKIPIGLAKIMDAVDHDHRWMLDKLAAADAQAIRLLEDPLTRMEIDGANGALAELADGGCWICPLQVDVISTGDPSAIYNWRAYSHS